MSSQDNAVLAHTIYNAFNNNDLDTILAHVADDVELIIMPYDQHFHGREGLRQFLQGFKDAFPDGTATLINQVIDTNKMVNEIIAKGTQIGALLGPNGEIPATGRSIRYHVCEVWELKQSKLLKVRTYFDTATMLQQLGVVLAPK